MENKPGKFCRKCKRFRPMSQFQTWRHKRCKLCVIKNATMGVAYAEHMMANPAPPKAATPALTSTPEGMAKYQRERHRDRMADKKPPLFTSKDGKKLCRRCQTRKAVSEFGSYRYRVCLACDGPSLLDLINNPPKPRIEEELPPLEPDDEEDK